MLPPVSVRLKNTSSSEPPRGDSSCKHDALVVSELAHLRRRPSPRSEAGPRPPGARPARPRARPPRQGARGCGVLTRTPPLPSRSSSSIDPWRTSRPLWITTTSSTVCAASLKTWLESRTVLPPPTRSRSKVRTQRMPCGSSPFSGSSRTRMSGSPSSADASPSRWRMPIEYFPTRRPAACSSPTIASSSSTRPRGSPANAASERR